jgi:transposase
MVLNVPSAYLGEYAIVFEELFGIKLTASRIYQIFQKHGINRKKVPVLLSTLRIATKRSQGA